MELKVLPASDGDCLLIAYGRPSRHILVDSGRGETYDHLKPLLRRISEANESLELVVATHFDADHITGLLRYVRDPEIGLEPKQVWFNGFDQLSPLQPMGERQADELSKMLADKRWPVNVSFHGGAACLPDDATPPKLSLDGGLEIVLLSPDKPRLARLRDRWEDWRQAAAGDDTAETDEPVDPALQKMGRRGRRQPPERLDVPRLASTLTPIDDQVPNGSSIAMLVEYDGRRILLAADAHPDLLLESVVKILPADEERLRVDVMKLSHHGSARNTTSELLHRIDCRRFIVSSNGRNHCHPDPETIAQILLMQSEEEKAFYFNYRQSWTNLWDQPETTNRYRYRCVFPEEETILTMTV